MGEGSGGRLRFFDCNMRVGRAGVVRPEQILDAAGLLGEMDYAGIDRGEPSRGSSALARRGRTPPGPACPRRPD